MIEIKQEIFDDGLKKQILLGLKRYDIAVTGHHELHDSLAFIARKEGVFAGVIVVQIFWGALHVKFLFTEEKFRNQKIGSQLMQQAFEFGKKNSCPFIFLETMNFHALEFYLKQGFLLEFTRSGYSHNSSLHYLKKIICY